jgi:hypothetical protein
VPFTPCWGGEAVAEGFAAPHRLVRAVDGAGRIG